MSNLKQQNIRLLIILLVLVAVSIALTFISGQPDNTIENPRIFAIDQNTVISDVSLGRADDRLDFNYTNQKWMVNGEFEMDIRMRDTFFGILSSLEVRRPVASSRNDSIANWLKSNGVEVKVSYLDEPVVEYTIGGDEESRITYAMDDENQCYVVRIPGYQNYIAGIFTVPELDWKSRILFNTNWLSLAGLTWDYTDPGKNDIEFTPGDPLFTIENLENIDSTRAMNYLEELIFLEADRLITADEAEQYESNVFLTCTLNDRQLGAQVVKFHEPVEGRSFTLIEINDDSYGLIRNQRIQGYYIEPEDLVKR